MIDSGELCFLATLLQPINTQDAAGQVITAYTAAGTAWVSVRPLWSRESQATKELNILGGFKITGRYIDMASVNALWRLQVDDGSGNATFTISDFQAYPQQDECSIVAVKLLNAAVPVTVVSVALISTNAFITTYRWTFSAPIGPGYHTPVGFKVNGQNSTDLDIASSTTHYDLHYVPAINPTTSTWTVTDNNSSIIFQNLQTAAAGTGTTI